MRLCWSSLTKSQAPDAVVLSCSDSRVPPGNRFDQGLGKKIRGPRLPKRPQRKLECASIEYAVGLSGTISSSVLAHCLLPGAGALRLNHPASKRAGSRRVHHLLGATSPDTLGHVSDLKKAPPTSFTEGPVPLRTSPPDHGPHHGDPRSCATRSRPVQVRLSMRSRARIGPVLFWK